MKEEKWKGYTVNSKLANNYDADKLAAIVHSFKSLSFEERILLHCHLALFIGMEDNSDSNLHPIKVNLAYISEKIGHKVDY